jgi:hypothetical protein
MNITTNLDGGFKFEEDRLRNENLARFGTEESDLRFEELYLLSGAAASDLKEAIDYRIEIDLVLVGPRVSSRAPERWPTGMERGGGFG